MDTNRLSDYELTTTPKSIYYIPHFITEEEENEIIKNVYEVPKPKWTNLKNRRLQDWGGVPHKNGMIQEEIPDWLKTYMTRISDLKVYDSHIANHVLINEYLTGQGIMPHLDGMLFYPTIATISCGSHTVLEFVDANDRSKLCDLFLERCSLVIIKHDMYTNYMHSISEITEDKFINNYANEKLLSKSFVLNEIIPRKTRISLTIRNVPKVHKLKLNQLFNKSLK